MIFSPQSPTATLQAPTQPRLRPLQRFLKCLNPGYTNAQFVILFFLLLLLVLTLFPPPPALLLILLNLRRRSKSKRSRDQNTIFRYFPSTPSPLPLLLLLLLFPPCPHPRKSRCNAKGDDRGLAFFSGVISGISDALPPPPCPHPFPPALFLILLPLFSLDVFNHPRV